MQAAVVDPMGKVICIGETSIDENYDPTAHAEVNSIRQACKILKISSFPNYYWLYSTFEPCPLCSAAAIWAGLDRIVYANNPNYRGKEPNWSFLSCEEVLIAGSSIHSVSLIKNFKIDDIKSYFTRHDM
ncbi:nucleoside deaminase [Enterococcus faecalis]|uniref:nucleoside deaminase n=1 Tax=Enterococcus faecalis TaxID=1351 RepID=UPI0021C5EBBB|nr:nucleoside deaminase [Enterococcus faecalis]